MKPLGTALAIVWWLPALVWGADGNAPLESRQALEDRTAFEKPSLMENPAPLEQANLTWVVDHTTSFSGGVFFRAFAQAWQEKQVLGGGAIVVEEVPQALWATRLRIWVNDHLLTQAQYYPNQVRDVASLGTRTAEFAYSRLQEMQTPK